MYKKTNVLFSLSFFLSKVFHAYAWYGTNDQRMFFVCCSERMGEKFSLKVKSWKRNISWYSQDHQGGKKFYRPTILSFWSLGWNDFWGTSLGVAGSFTSNFNFILFLFVVKVIDSICSNWLLIYFIFMSVFKVNIDNKFCKAALVWF
jgi:hypothetical protein